MRRLVPILLICFILLSSSPAFGQAHWAQPALDHLMGRGIVRFQEFEDLDRPITPEEWNGVISRAMGLVAGDDGIEGSLRNTIANYTMNPGGGEYLTRASAFGGLMKILRIYGAVGSTDTAEGDERVFTDWQNIPADYRNLLGLGVRHGLVTGYPDGRFLPGRVISVAEGLVFLQRALERYGFMEVIRVPSIAGPSARDKTDDGINLVVYTDRAFYRGNDTVAIIAGVENRSFASVSYTKWRVGDPTVYVWVEVGPVRVFLEEDDLSPLRLPAVTLEKLPPRSAVIQRIAWDLAETGAKPGIYTIVATFYPLRSSENPANPDIIRVRLEVEIKGDETVAAQVTPD